MELTDYQQYLSQECENVLKADWSQGFDQDEALEYCRLMNRMQPEYNDDVAKSTNAWKERFAGKPAGKKKEQEAMMAANDDMSSVRNSAGKQKEEDAE